MRERRGKERRKRGGRSKVDEKRRTSRGTRRR